MDRRRATDGRRRGRFEPPLMLACLALCFQAEAVGGCRESWNDNLRIFHVNPSPLFGRPSDSLDPLPANSGGGDNLEWVRMTPLLAGWPRADWGGGQKRGGHVNAVMRHPRPLPILVLWSALVGRSRLKLALAGPRHITRRVAGGGGLHNENENLLRGCRHLQPARCRTTTQIVWTSPRPMSGRGLAKLLLQFGAAANPPAAQVAFRRVDTRVGACIQKPWNPKKKFPRAVVPGEGRLGA